MVQSYSIYWAKQSSAVIQEGYDCVCVCVCVCICVCLLMLVAFTSASDAYLLFANQWFIRMLQTNGSGLHVVLSNLDNAGGLDYHYRFVYGNSASLLTNDVIKM